MRKRAHGEGTITKRSDGRWMGRITLPKYGSKKPLRKTVYGCTQKECRDKLESLKKQAGKRLDYHRRSESLDEYLTHWLKTIKINRRIRTFDSYNGLANRHVRPHIGSIKLEDLHAEDLERWQAELVENGCSDKTRKSAIAVLRSSLNHAVKSRIVDFNPITVLTIPKADTKM